MGMYGSRGGLRLSMPLKRSSTMEESPGPLTRGAEVPRCERAGFVGKQVVDQRTDGSRPSDDSGAAEDSHTERRDRGV